MTMYKIEGRNAQGARGTWEIEASDKDDAFGIIMARGIQADTINGETVKQTKPKTLKGERDDGV